MGHRLEWRDSFWSGDREDSGGPRRRATSGSEDSSDGDSDANILEDLVLQAEIFLQYGLKPKAIERLERVNKLFPGEEERNEKLRQLYAMVGMEVATRAKQTPA